MKINRFMWSPARRELVKELARGLLDISGRTHFRSFDEALQALFEARQNSNQPVLIIMTGAMAYTETVQFERDQKGYVISEVMHARVRRFRIDRTINPLIEAGYLELLNTTSLSFASRRYGISVSLLDEIWKWRGKNKILNPSSRSFEIKPRRRRDVYFKFRDGAAS